LKDRNKQKETVKFYGWDEEVEKVSHDLFLASKLEAHNQ
jgi:hypothetical protein